MKLRTWVDQSVPINKVQQYFSHLMKSCNHETKQIQRLLKKEILLVTETSNKTEIL